MKVIGNYVFFYTNYMSNFHKCHFVDPATNIPFRTTEQAFMWYKADFFKDPNTRKALEDYALSPQEAKGLGRLVANYSDPAWETVRFGFMTYANYLKFSQNEDLRVKLLATGDKILVEASPVDNIWGIGLAESEEDWILTDQKNWTGRNLLGEALMKVRSIIK